MIKAIFFNKINLINNNRNTLRTVPKEMPCDSVCISDEAKKAAKEEVEESKTKPIQGNEPVIIDLEDLDISNGVKYPPLDPLNIDPKSLCLVHITEFEPKGNTILSAKDALTQDGIGASRNSVHFSINHPVAAHRWGDWDNLPYSIIMPYEATKQANPHGKIIEGLPNDLYTNGSVIIPQGSVIIKQNSEIESGKIKVSDYPYIEGVKLIETSQAPHSITNSIIEKMGYSSSSVDNGMGLFEDKISKSSKEDFLNDMEKNFKSWLEFCQKEGIKPMKHSSSINGLAESLIESIDMLATTDSWEIKNTNYKKLILETIKLINKNARQSNYFLSYDTSKLAKIIKQSKTPSQALELIRSELKLKPILHRERKPYSEHNDYSCSLDMRLKGLKDRQTYIDFYNNRLSPEETRKTIEEALVFDLLYIK